MVSARVSPARVGFAEHSLVSRSNPHSNPASFSRWMISLLSPKEDSPLRLSCAYWRGASGGHEVGSGGAAPSLCKNLVCTQAPIVLFDEPHIWLINLNFV